MPKTSSKKSDKKEDKKSKTVEKKDTKKKSKKEESSSSEESSPANDSSSEDSSSEEKVVEKKAPQKRNDRPAAVEEPPAKKSKNCSLFVGNLPFSVSEEMIREFFSENGIELTGIRLAKDNNTGKFKGFGHVDVDSEEDMNKALELAGSDLGGREVKIDAANSTKPSGPEETSKTVFIGNLSFDADEESLQAFLEENQCDRITQVRIIKDENGGSKGFGYVEFEDVDAATAAVGLHGLELEGRNLRINYDCNKPTRGGGRGGGRGGDRGFGGGRGGGRGFGGGRGDRGGFRGGDRGGFGGRGRGGDRGFGGGRGGGRGFGGDRGGRGGRGGSSGYQGKKIVFE